MSDEQVESMCLMMEQLAGNVRELTYTVRDLISVIEELKWEKVKERTSVLTNTRRGI